MHRRPLMLLLLASLTIVASCKDGQKTGQKTGQEQVIPKVGESSPSVGEAKERALPKSETPSALDPDAVLSKEEQASLGGLEPFASEEYLLRLIETRNSVDWFGFYIGSNKAGYARIEMRKSKADEPGAFHVGMEIHIKNDGDIMGTKRMAYFEGKAPFRSLLIRTVESANTGRVEHSFIRADDRTRVETIIDGKAKPITWGPEMCNTLASTVAELAPDVGALAAGHKAKVCSFSEDELKQEINELRVESVVDRLVSGVKLKVATIASRTGDSKQWIQATLAEFGTAIEVSLGPGVALKLEDKEVAQSNVEGVDINSIAVKINKPLANPTTIKELTLKAHLAEGFVPPPSTPNQQFEKLADNVYKVTIRSVPGAKVLASERKEAQAPTTEIDSRDPAIVAMAKTITVGASSNKEKVALLNHWVYANLDKSLSTNLVTASQVLEHRTGDCTEHSILLLALLCSLDIPARELGGLVYLDGEFSAFGWHAWTEVEIDGHWVQVDPSWDEVVGNATHLSLGEDAAMNMGAIKLEVL